MTLFRRPMLSRPYTMEDIGLKMYYYSPYCEHLFIRLSDALMQSS